jgi:hypothetical protein
VLGSAALACVYLAVLSGHSYSIDGLLMYRQALSIAHDHSLQFGTPIWWGDSYSTSKYGIGLSLLYLPGTLLFGWLASAPAPHGITYDWDLFYRDPLYTLAASPVHIAITVATAFLVAGLVRELGQGPRAALLALFAYGIGSPAIVYARGDFSQPLLGLCLVAGVLAAVRYRRTGGPGALLVGGASLVYAVLTRPVEGSFLLPALLFLLVFPPRGERPPPRRFGPAATIVAAYLLAVGITGLINWARSGTPLPIGYQGEGWSTPIWIGLPGLLFSPARGILLAFPFLLLAPRGLRRLLATEQRQVALAIAGILLALLLNNALWSSWWGSWSWGPRLLVPALPLLAVPAAIGAVSLRPGLRSWLPGLLLLAGVAWAVPGTVTDLLAGYGAAHDSPGRSWALTGYPPFWAVIHGGTVDILWFRLARAGGYLFLLVPVALLGLAAYLAMVVRKAASASPLPVRSSG